MTLINIQFNCNDPDGNFDEQITQIIMGENGEIIIDGYPLTMYQVTTNDNRTLLHIEDLDEDDSIIRIPYVTRTLRHGNNCWNSYDIESSEALRLIEYMRNCWQCEGVETFVKVFNNKGELTEALLLETLDLTPPPMPKVGEYYRHYKGNIYKIVDTPRSADTGHPILTPGVTKVWYQCIWSKEQDKIGGIWWRSLKEFRENVDANSLQKERFQLLPDNIYSKKTPEWLNEDYYSATV